MQQLPSLGRYEALFPIAAGGMAQVFAARMRGEAGFEKLVAAKRMLPHLASDEHFVEMFLDEAKVAVHVSSPHVVQTFDLGRADDGAPFIIMELVVGCSLAALLREARGRHSRVPLRIALELVAQAAQGLDDAHEASTPTGLRLDLVHRDVSPQNILVGVDGRTRVADFGIARAILRRSSTAAGDLRGKFAYFSPEQAEGKPLDRRSDVFALGCVAFEVIAGRRLFRSDYANELLAQVKGADIPALHEIDETVPRGVSLAVARALERPLDRRWPTAGDFATALRDAALELGPRASQREIAAWVAESGGDALAEMRERIDRALAGDDVPTTELRAVMHPAAATGSLVGVATEPQRSGDTLDAPPAATRRPRGVIVAIALGGVALLAGVGWIALGRGSTGASAASDTTTSASIAPPRASESGTIAPALASTTILVEPAAPASSARPSLVRVPPRPPRSLVPMPPVASVASAPPAATPTTTAQPVPSAPTPAPTRTTPRSPILGDDAFKVP